MSEADDYDPYQLNADHEPHSWAQIPQYDDHQVSPETFHSTINTLYADLPETPGLSHVVSMDGKEVTGVYLAEQWNQELRQPRSLLRSWWQEILSSIVSVICVVAIALILQNIDGTLLSSWGIAVSPNAVISILSTTAKATMILPIAESISQFKWLHLYKSKNSLEQLQIFDNASRGPSGALTFFLQAKQISPIPYFGCILVIVALALDPFTQQIISYQSLSTPIANQNSSVAHSLVFDKGNYALQVTGDFNVVSNFRDQDVIAGGLSGLYGVLPVPPFSCPGANCTFPVTTSLGVCNTCNNVTTQAQVDCHNNLTAAEMSSTIVNYCNYTLPHGSQFNFTTTFSPHNGVSNPTMNITVNETSPTYTTLLDIGIVHFIQNLTSESYTDWQDTMTAYECSFELCAWSFTNWSYVDGTLVHGSTSQSQLNHTWGDDIYYNETWFYYKALDPDFPGNETYVLNNFDKDGIVANLEELFTTDYFVNSIYQTSDDVTSGLKDFATGTTYNMMSGPNTTDALGLVLENQTYIHVRWAWLSLSIAMAVLSVLFLAVTIFMTHKAELQAWKSSLKPLVFADSNIKYVGSASSEKGWTDEQKLQRVTVIREVLK